MAAPRITQATFDAVVAENVEDFEMSPEEAVADAIEQFTSQGVDLTNIVTKAVDTEHPVLVSLAGLRSALDAESEDYAPVVAALQELRTLCKDNKEHKTIAANAGALDLVGDLVTSASGEKEVVSTACMTVRTLITKHMENRKLVKETFVTGVTNVIVGAPEDPDLLANALGVAASACIRSEAHKKVVYESGVPEAVVTFLTDHRENTRVLKESLALVRISVTNDDRNAAMSKTFDYARELHEKSMTEAVLGVAGSSTKHAGLSTDCFTLLKSLCVNNTIATDMVEGKVLDVVTEAMSELPEDKKVAAAGCALLRALAGNDDNKKIIGHPESPSLKVLLKALQSQVEEAKVVEQACGALAALTLRSPENASTVVEAGAHTLIATAMRKHIKSANVSRQAALAIRNIVSRSPELREKMLSENLDKLLRATRDTHASARDTAKAALRDMGLEYNDDGDEKK